MAEAGYPQIEGDSWVGVMVPAGTPKEIIDTLHREVVNTLALPEMKARLAELGYDPVGSTPEEFAIRIKAEIETWARDQGGPHQSRVGGPDRAPIFHIVRGAIPPPCSRSVLPLCQAAASAPLAGRCYGEWSIHPTAILQASQTFANAARSFCPSGTPQPLTASNPAVAL
jgi:Tripartite tricarboxylate transporter family receptor